MLSILVIGVSVLAELGAYATRELHELPPAADSITVEHICGNLFHARNFGDASIKVRWAVRGTSDTGVVTLPARPRGHSFSQVDLVTRIKGPTRVASRRQVVWARPDGTGSCAERTFSDTILPAPSKPFLDSLPLRPFDSERPDLDLVVGSVILVTFRETATAEDKAFVRDTLLHADLLGMWYSEPSALSTYCFLVRDSLDLEQLVLRASAASKDRRVLGAEVLTVMDRWLPSRRPPWDLLLVTRDAVPRRGRPFESPGIRVLDGS